MSTSALMLAGTGHQSLADWSAVAFVASYSSAGTQQAYATQLRLWFQWCRDHGLEPLTEVRRPHLELYARDLEARGLAPATVALKLVVLTGWYRYCVEEQLLEHSPAVHVRRPKVSQESTRLGLDRAELGAFLVQVGVARPLAPRTTRAIDTAVAERTDGPLLARRDGSRHDRHAAGRIVRRLAKRAGIDKRISPHSLRQLLKRSLGRPLPLPAVIGLRGQQEELLAAHRPRRSASRITSPIRSTASTSTQRPRSGPCPGCGTAYLAPADEATDRFGATTTDAEV
jgi:hypothetical protein